jgi:hypothetical protein
MVIERERVIGSLRRQRRANDTEARRISSCTRARSSITPRRAADLPVAVERAAQRAHANRPGLADTTYLATHLRHHPRRRDALTDRAKTDLIGQAKFLKDAYVSRGELHPDAAVFLDAVLQ